MNGVDAMTLALAVAGNRVLGGLQIADFWPHSDIFQFVEYVRFAESERGLIAGVGPHIVAGDPKQWFQRLAEDRTGLMVRRIPREKTAEGVTSRALAGFLGGGDRWIIEAMGPKGSDLWAGVWQVGDQKAADRRIWQVHYDCVAHDRREPWGNDRPLGDISTDLAANLTAIAAFAREQGLQNWGEIFDGARAVLSGAAAIDPATDYNSFAVSLATDARHLLAACSQASVFGGMGSWNDVPLTDGAQPRYDALSQRLYELTQEGAIAAANTSLAFVVRR